MAQRVSSPVFVGRERELDRVTAALKQAASGQTAVFLVAGEAGVGKTRLVAEIATRARRSGARVLEGGCVPVGNAGLPFGPFIESLRGLTDDTPADELNALLGAGRAELARLMPQLLRPGETEQVVEGDPSGQSRLFEHLLLLLGRLADRTPLLFLVEDLHWADRSTLELLGFLTRNLRSRPIVLLATYRSDELHRRHPLLPFLAEQERAGRAERIELHRFEWSELTAQVRAILGHEPDADVIERIMARSQGNAFYAEELLAGGAIVPGGRLPDTLREVLLARLANLGEPAQAIVRVASAGGARISADVLAAVTETPHRELEAALLGAIAGHVLVPIEGTAGERYAFRHALVQEAAYGELLPGARTRLHSAFARVLAAGGHVDGAAGAAEIAYHWQAANDLPRAFDAWLAAGIGAERLYAFAEAAASYDNALELWDKVPDADARAPIDRVEVLTRAALAAEGTAPTRSVEYIRSAVRLVDPATDPVRAGLLHMTLGHNLGDIGDESRALAAYEEGVRLVPAEPPSAARARVLAGLGTFFTHIGRIEDSEALCSEAVAVAAAAGVTEVWAMVPLGLDRVILGEVEAGVATLREARDLAAAHGSVYQVARASGWLIHALIDAGLDEEANVVAGEAEAWAASHGMGARWGAANALHRADALLALGRWDEAADAIASAQRYGRVGTAERWMELQFAQLEAMRGQFDSAASRIARLPALASGGYDHALFVAPTELALLRGDPLAARSAVQAATIRRPRERHVAVRYIGQALVLALRAEADVAASARVRRVELDILEARSRGAAFLHDMRSIYEEVRTQRPYYVSMASAFLALCEAEFARLEGRPEPEAWAAAATALDGQPYARAYALTREGEAALGGQRDRVRASAALDEARGIAIKLGARPMLQLIETLASAERSARPPAAQGAERRGRYDLTPRELEVLRLLADGRSDREIANGLFISKKTVSVHLANIKGKLGARSRVEIVTSAMAMGLIAAPISGPTLPP